MSALHWAASRRHRAAVELLLERGANVDAGNQADRTPLHMAVSSGHDAIAALLIRNGSSTNARAKPSLETPLHIAARHGYERIVWILLKNGANIHARDSIGKTPLHAAAIFGQTAVAALLLEMGADRYARDRYGTTVLGWAVKGGRGHKGMIKMLLEKGTDITCHNYERMTALHLAACSGHEATVRVLLDHGADIASRASADSTPLHEAALGGSEAVVKLLLERGANILARARGWKATPIHCAALQGHTAVAKLLLENGADVGARNDFGATPLHNAGHGPMVELLLRNGADIEARNWRGRTPLHGTVDLGESECVLKRALTRLTEIAAWDIQESRANKFTLLSTSRYSMEIGNDIVCLLLGNGKNITVRDQNGAAAIQQRLEELNPVHARLHLEALAESLFLPKHSHVTADRWDLRDRKDALMTLLLMEGADVAAQDYDGMTALHMAARSQDEAMAIQLLIYGADIGAQEHAGRTPLHEAQDINILRVLHEGGASIAARDYQGRTVLHLAAGLSLNSEMMVRYLLMRQAPIFARDSDGNTALWVAATAYIKAVQVNDYLSSLVHETVIRLLVAHGADLRQETSIEMRRRLLHIITQGFSKASNVRFFETLW